MFKMGLIAITTTHVVYETSIGRLHKALRVATATNAAEVERTLLSSGVFQWEIQVRKEASVTEGESLSG